MTELGLCGRCLVILNARTTVTARRGDQVEICPHPTDSRALRRWAEEKLWGDGAVLAIDDMPYAFDPVTTWHGDPVCASHLIECRQREVMGHDRRSR